MNVTHPLHPAMHHNEDSAAIALAEEEREARQAKEKSEARGENLYVLGRITLAALSDRFAWIVPSGAAIG